MLLVPRAPNLRRILEIDAHFVVNVNPTGNPTLFEWLKGVHLEKRTITTKNETIELQFCNNIPLNDANCDLLVNFIDCVVRDKKGKKTHFSWITDLTVTQDNVYTLARVGRARWHIENETFNTLKNQGYQFEHNFGHGYKNLSHVFGLLMFLAFLIDQVEQRCCGMFQQALQKAKRKVRFWEKLRMYFLGFYLDSWSDLFAVMAQNSRVRVVAITNTS